MSQNGAPALEVEGLVKRFPAGNQLVGASGVVHAVEEVSFSIAPGELLGLVGESGSGKTTVANCVLRLVEPTAGTIRLHGDDITHLSRRALRPYRRELHMVFQDPYSSLNPRRTTGQIVAEPIRIHRIASGKSVDKRVCALFDRVGLRPELRFRYPHELSGGQRQRVGLARALSVSPSVLVADEPVSALDVSVQASILNLLRDLQQDLGFSCLFITHDLSTVEFLCDRVAVMYLGRIVEVATVRDLFGSPKHPYTQALLSAAVVPDPKQQRRRARVVLSGDIPSPITPPSGCAFRTRCPLARQICVDELPPLRQVGGAHAAACHLIGPGGEAPRIAAPQEVDGDGPAADADVAAEAGR
jgi:oligopeptide/dipeptide ABC transporter ATP-binding protein